jgi:hypothetical protein
MGANLNPREIHHFLHGYRPSAQGYGQSPYYGYYGHVPRYAPSVTGSEVLGSDDSAQSDDARSEFTTASTATSQAYTTRSATPPSLFSRRDDDQSSVGGSTAPELGVPQMPFAQQFQNPNNAPQRPGQILWCEFSELLGCQETFSLDDETSWVDHHALHLHDSFPRRLMCWFCDHEHAPFVARAPDYGFANFEDRMQHIRGHILSDHRWTSEHMRPDFHMITHLHDNGLIDDFMFHHAMSYNELPDRYRLPGSHSHSSSKPHGQQSAAPREKGQYHDLDKERRAERRRQKEKQSGRRR